MKKAENNKPDENPVLNISQKQIESSKRMQVLSKNISDAIKKSNDEIDGEFTMMEIIYVMNQNVNAYAKHNLKNEWS